MKRFCLIFYAFIVAACNAEGFPKIVNGTEVDITQVPYIAAVEFLGRFSCPAVVIATRWLASSAWCMELSDPDDLVVRTGATNYEQGGRFYPVQSLRTHPLYDTDSSVALTLIELALDIVENNGTKIIPVANSEPAVGTQARVSGWGAVATGSIMHRSLLSVELPIFNRTLCNEHYEISDLQLCTLKEGAGPCEYDDGDPLVADGVLVGIKTWVLNEQCGDINWPSPYVNLAHPIVRDFIKNVTGV